ncbi:putative reverse transcriptase domain-containing protein [Tanacetum coccineum]
MNHHRKKRIEVPTEREFRGYYALLKLDKHPGYKVEPSELSLDLAKMTHGIRQATEVLFARKPAELVALDHYRDAFSVIYLIYAHSSSYVGLIRGLPILPSSGQESWSIPSEDPYEEAARQLLEQAPRPSEYVPDPMELEDHVPVYIPEPEHPEDLVPAEDEAPIEPYITEVASAPTPPLPPPSLLPTLIRPPHTRAAMAQRRATGPSYIHSYFLLGRIIVTIPLPAPSTSRRADIPEADTPPRKRLLLTAPTLGGLRWALLLLLLDNQDLLWPPRYCGERGCLLSTESIETVRPLARYLGLGGLATRWTTLEYMVVVPRTPAAAEYQRTLTCYECGGLGHYKRDCPELKNQNHGDQVGSMEARGVIHAFIGGETKQDLNNMRYIEIKA